MAFQHSYSFNNIGLVGFSRGGAGPNVWYDSQLQGAGTPGTTYNQSYATMWIGVAVLTGGSATRIRFYSNGGAASGNVNYGLWNGAGVLIGSTGVQVVSIAGSQWVDFALSSPVTVTTGLYYVGVLDDGATIGWEIDTAAAVNGFRDADSAYSTLPNPLNTNDNPPGGKPTAGLFVA